MPRGAIVLHAQNKSIGLLRLRGRSMYTHLGWGAKWKGVLFTMTGISCVALDAGTHAGDVSLSETNWHWISTAVRLLQMPCYRIPTRDQRLLACSRRYRIGYRGHCTLFASKDTMHGCVAGFAKTREFRRSVWTNQEDSLLAEHA